MSSYLYNVLDKTRRMITPVLSQSVFLEKGMLTPDEFVKAGDNLVHNCPSWQWSSGDPSMVQSYLPKDKQYLITKGVACYNRVGTMAAMHSVDEMSGENEGWCAPNARAPDTQGDDEDSILISSKDLDEEGDDVAAAGSSAVSGSVAGGGSAQDTGNNASTASSSNSINDKGKAAALANDESDCLDMEDDSLALEDEDGAASGDLKGKEAQSSVIKSRRYDISITYDSYYSTPRIWLFGYNERGTTLSIEQIYQDVMQDYAQKTVDQAPHPHTGKDHASIHPCKHSSAMLSFINALTESGRQPIVENYMFIFLKFIQSVVPTIEYDFTLDVEIFGGGGGGNSSSNSSNSSSKGSGAK